MNKIAIFASGAGSNARKLIAHFHDNPEVQIDLIVSNRSRAGVLDIAAESHIDCLVVSREMFYDSTELLDTLQSRHIGFVVLAGFLWLVPEYLVDAYPRKIVNIHPALLPKFGGKGMYGMHVHEAVKNAGETQTGITIHYVNKFYDEGDVIFQAACPVDPADDPPAIARKVQQLEHRHFPVVIDSLLSGKG